MNNDKSKREGGMEVRRKPGDTHGAVPGALNVRTVMAMNAAATPPAQMGAAPMDTVLTGLARSVYGPINFAGPFTSVTSANELTGAIPFGDDRGQMTEGR